MNYGVPSAATVLVMGDRSLISGTEMQIAYEDLTIAESQDLEALTVVTINDDGDVIKATSATAAIGVIAVPVKTEAGETKTASVIRAGVLNPDALIFDASYATIASKVGAFRGASTPTNIIVKRAF